MEWGKTRTQGFISAREAFVSVCLLRSLFAFHFYFGFPCPDELIVPFKTFSRVWWCVFDFAPIVLFRIRLGFSPYLHYAFLPYSFVGNCRVIIRLVLVDASLTTLILIRGDREKN